MLTSGTQSCLLLSAIFVNLDVKYYDVFVYGTLRKGGTNDHYLSGSLRLKEAIRISGFCLYDYRHRYPYMLEAAPEESVLGEVYRVDEPTLEQLNILEDIENQLYRLVYLERYGFYTYLKYDNDVSELYRISGGDWLAYINEIQS